MFCDFILGLHRSQPVSGSPPTFFGMLCVEPMSQNIRKCTVEALALKQIGDQTWYVVLFELKKMHRFGGCSWHDRKIQLPCGHFVV